MVEQKFGYEVVDQILNSSNLASNGIYTAIGTYPHSEVVELLMNLSDTVQLDPTLLLEEFGKYLFDTFLQSYPQFFTSVDNAFAFLHSIDRHIHVEVLKLYPDATLPKFDSREIEDGAMIMTYKSERKMAALALGLIKRSVVHYNENCDITSTNIEEDGSVVEFKIKRKDG